MESPSSPYEQSSGATSKERFNREDSMLDSYQTSVEPEPSSVVARLKKEALDNPQKEQSIEDLLSSMGVSLVPDQRMLDYSMAVHYGGPTFRDGVLKDRPPSRSLNSEIEQSESIHSIPVAVPLPLPGGKKPVKSTQIRAAMPLATPEEQIQIETNQNVGQNGSPGSSVIAEEAGASTRFNSSHEPAQNDVEASVDSVAKKSLGVTQPSPSSLSPLESIQDMSNGPSVVPRATNDPSTADETPPQMHEPVSKPVFHIPKHSDQVSIDVTSAISEVNCAKPVSQRVPSSPEGHNCSATSSASSSVVFASPELPADSEQRQHEIMHRSGLSIDRPSELDAPNMEALLMVNIPNHGGDRQPIPPSLPWKKRGCAGCGKNNLLLDKEYCMSCGNTYCGSCLLAAMGSMPEGRKCVACLGRPILGSRRPYIGKPSRLLKHLLSPLEVQQIMKAEREGPANQLRPEQVIVNNRPLSQDEFAALLGCYRPPVKLKPGRYWYDGQTGLWGKDGHRPDRIVTPSLKLGGNLQPNASNGKTQVFMNGRELGKVELKMLKFAGVNCPPETHLWVENDGSYSEEGFKNVKGNIWGKEGNLWEKASIKLLYPFFSMPTPRSNLGVGDGSGRHSNRFAGLLDPLRVHKLLLLGHEGSGRSTIFKQAKILYNEGFTKEEVVSFRGLIRANIYKYLAILLEGRERFEEEDDDLSNVPGSQLSVSRASGAEDGRGSSSTQADVAGLVKWNEEKRKQKEGSTIVDNIYRLDPGAKELSEWFAERLGQGNLESGSPLGPDAHLQEHATKIQQLWLSPAVQATFQRKWELPFLPDVASVFLDRVVEVWRSEYEPAEMDILQTEGLSQGSGLVQIEICLDDKDLGSWQDADICSGLERYQVIRVGGKGMSDRHKWLDMFEDVRAVVFCVSLSDYNAVWTDRSGSLSNKMLQTRELFESILRHPCFQDTPFVLLLNKYDVFEEKIEKGVALTTCTWFSEFRPVGTSHYTAQNQAQQAYQYIVHKYKELFNSVNCTGRKLFTFQLNALDKSTVSGAFRYVKEILKWEEHKAAGWGMIPEESSYSTDVSSFSHRGQSEHSARRQQY